MKYIKISGIEIPYIHKKSDRRTISAFVNKCGILEVRTPGSVSIDFVREFILTNNKKILQMLERSNARRNYEERLDDSELDRLRRKAETVIPERVMYYSRVMGVTPAKVRINSAKTRFGSCSSKGNLNFSCRLMAYSAKAVDYVVIHELSHLFHMDHSAAFWRIVAKYMPDYKIAKQELNMVPQFDS